LAAQSKHFGAVTDVLSSLTKAIGQLADPAVMRVLAKSLGVTLLIFALTGAALMYAIYQGLIAVGVAFSAELSGLLAVLAIILGAWLWFRVVALAVLQFFADDIVQAVEAKHYPDACEAARRLPFREDFGNSMRGLGRAIGFNLLAAPIALILLFTAIGPAIVFIFVNAVLLGRELTDMAWLRHCDPGETRSPVNGLNRLALGAVIAGLMLVPFANFLAPILGAAAGTHLTHRAMERVKHG